MDTIRKVCPEIECSDCGAVGTQFAHWGPLVPLGEKGNFCSDCWTERGVRSSQGLPALPLGQKGPQRERGLYGKFQVARRDRRDEPGGDREGAEYFVLDLTYDRPSRVALLAYADAVAAEYPILAADLRAQVARLGGV